MFEAAWRRSLTGELPPTEPLDPKLVDYPEVGRQGAAVQRLLGVVPRDRVHFVVLDDLAADPHAVWQDVVTFCGLDPGFVPSFSVVNASTKTARYARVRELTHRPPPVLAPTMTMVRQWSRTTDSAVVRRVKASMWQAAARPCLPPHVRQQLTAYYRDDVELLGMLLGRDLHAWA
jgi:hypothetical protein